MKESVWGFHFDRIIEPSELINKSVVFGFSRRLGVPGNTKLNSTGA